MRLTLLKTRPLILAGLQYLWGLAVFLGASSCIGISRYLNREVDPEVPWFLVVVALVCSAVTWYGARFSAGAEDSRRGPKAFLLSVLLGVALAGLSLMLSGVLTGKHYIMLPGDGERAPPLFKLATALSEALGAGFLEESTMRGVVQLALVKYVGPKMAEAIASTTFVLMHGRKLINLRELLLVSATSFCAGRVTTVTRTMRCAIAIHLVCNALIVAVALALRHSDATARP